MKLNYTTGPGISREMAELQDIMFLGRSAFYRDGAFLGRSEFQSGWGVSRSIGISQDGAFLGRLAFQRMGRLKGWGVSRSIGISKWMGRVSFGRHFTGWGISRSIGNSKDGVSQRIGCFSVDRHFPG